MGTLVLGGDSSQLCTGIEEEEEGEVRDLMYSEILRWRGRNDLDREKEWHLMGKGVHGEVNFPKEGNTFH